jgi:haloalkane dehalogenase
MRRAYVGPPGAQLHYREAGTGPTLLLLHQAPSHSAMYEPLMQLLEDRYHLLAPDLPGFGLSDPLPPGPVEVADYARAVRRLLQALDVTSCLVFGHHAGAAVAVQLESAWPGTARAMALSGPPLLTEAQRRELPGMACSLAAGDDGAHLLGIWQRLRDKDPQAPLAIRQRETLSALASPEAYADCYAAVARQPFADLLPAVRCPVLAFAGGLDPLQPALQPTLDALPDAHTVAAPGEARTYICERQAPWVAAQLHTFFAELGE